MYGAKEIPTRTSTDWHELISFPRPSRAVVQPFTADVTAGNHPLCFEFTAGRCLALLRKRMVLPLLDHSPEALRCRVRDGMVGKWHSDDRYTPTARI